MLNSCVNPTEPSSWIDASGNLILAHPDVIRRYYREIDVTLIRENLKLTPVQRLRKLEEFVAFIKKLEGAERQSLADDVSIQVVGLDALIRLKNACWPGKGLRSRSRVAPYQRRTEANQFTRSAINRAARQTLIERVRPKQPT